jgi:Protein of unknown function (DUF3016)
VRVSLSFAEDGMRYPFAFIASAAVAWLGLVGAPCPARAAGVVDVRFDQPGSFTDIGRSSADRESTLKSLRGYLQSLAARLPDGHTLRIEITDVDLAGHLVPTATRDIRIVRRPGADWPRIALRYKLLAEDHLVASGTGDLGDMDYASRAARMQFRRGELPYEDALLLKWFDETIVAP